MDKIEKKKLVFITARLPYPANSGRKNVMYNYCRILHNVYNYEITIISFLESGDVIEPKPDFIYKVIELKSINGIQKLFNLIKNTFLLRKYPMQVSLFYKTSYKKFINQTICKIKPNMVMADMVRTTEYVKDCDCFSIANLDDMISVRYERQLNMDIDTINPYGAYLYGLPYFVQKFLSLGFIKKAVLKNEVKLLKKYEQNISTFYNKTVFVAQREADILNKIMGFDKAIAIPLGVDIDYYGKFFNKIKIQKHTIAFLGAMSVAHNEAGAIYFIKNILPLVIRKIPDVKFIIIGGGVPEHLKSMKNSHIEFAGQVPDVRMVVGACEVFVCPLTFGSGIKTKNLEAMAMGVPVVTTSIGAENINARNGYEWIIEDVPELFAEKIVDIMSDFSLQNTLKNNAYKFVCNNFTWKIAEERFGTIVSYI